MRKFVKKALSAVLSAAMVIGGLTVTAPQVTYAANSFTTVGGWNEAIYATISGVKDADVTGVSYSGAMSGSLTGADLQYLVRDVSGSVRIDIPGLKAGTYNLTVTTKSGSYEQSGIVVDAYDRSGYAHFNYTQGVGAYNDDGTLKSNAIVIYVTDDNKNSVELSYGGTTVNGIGNILNSVGMECGEAGHAGQCKKVTSDGKTYYGKANTNQGIIKKLADAGVPLVVRFIGVVSESGLYKQGTYSAKDLGLIDGLTDYSTVADFIDYGGTKGDNGHMARMKSGKDITLEGIGTDATLDGWGIHFMAETSSPSLGKSFEVRNLTFINTPEDAIGMEGVQKNDAVTSEITASVERCWVHNNNFYCPNISNPAESDKAQGDGSCDFKRGMYFTCSYNYFEGCHKTNLVGSSKTSLQYCLSYHHNYWKSCESRGPLSRNANMHFYNNLYENQSSYCMDARASAFIFSEYNIFYECKSPHTINTSEGPAGVIKSYNDWLASYINDDLCTEVTNKSTPVANNCKYQFGKIDYSQFELDSNLSYIPSGNYELQNNATDLKKVIAAKTGIMKANVKKVEQISDSDVSYLPSGTTPVSVSTFPFEAKPGKISAGFNVYAFTVPTSADVTCEMTGAVLVNEMGQTYLSASGTARSIPAGTYMVQAASFDAKTGKFKDCTLASISIKNSDPNYDPNKLTAVKLNKTSATLLVGGTVALVVNLVPETANVSEKAVWTSSDSTVATVSDGGLVTAKKVGKTTVTVTVGDFNAKCDVVVSEPVSITEATISSSELTLLAGTTETLTVGAKPANTTESYTTTWSSDNNDVASVSENGVVTAKTQGTATITATITTESGKTYSQTCSLTVEKGKELPSGDMVHSFTASDKTSTFYTISGNLSTSKGSVTYLGATLTKCLKMESDTSIKFTAASKGTLALVFKEASNTGAAYVDGKKYASDASGIVNVELEAGAHEIKKSNSTNLFYMAFVGAGSGSSSGDVISITGVTLNKTSATLKAGETVDLVATVAPDNTTESKSVNWSSSNPSVATVKAGKVTAVGAGSVTITATAVGDNTKSAECTITVASDDNGNTGSGSGSGDSGNTGNGTGTGDSGNTGSGSGSGNNSGNTGNNSGSENGKKNGWVTENGKKFWYEDGVKQGTEGRGKEIYDPESDGWYWLDAVEGGSVAVGKDVYQESFAGPWGDIENADGSRNGKWVRYDANGRMIKGWSEDKQYYFDETYGTMAKGYCTIEGTEYYFSAVDGKLEKTVLKDIGTYTGWKTIDGNQFWYENGVRQGVSPNPSYRGKEIFDPESNAWYWLDNVDGGKKAVSKDVYQESAAGDWGDKDGVDKDGNKIKIGKWVRYDAEGHMIKGWSADKKYYFDPVYGTMAKGTVKIGSEICSFDKATGERK